MLIVLTNGNYYIKTSSTGKIEKTDNILEAQTFRSCNLAIRKVLKAPKKCKGYYPFDIEDAGYGRGNDNMENLQSLCLACNQFKSNILPDEFNQRITEIFLYQMEKKNKGGVRWKVICKVLQKIVK